MLSFIRTTWQAAQASEKLAMVLTSLYILSPIDFIPELAFSVFGIADDLAALLMLISTVRRIRTRLGSGTVIPPNSNETPLKK
ncbi:MAG: DUF1232 domain-containing protein [Rhizobacter sp.]|nr:DUF1232 domain-containing protein [Chlorobiales bacterium]